MSLNGARMRYVDENGEEVLVPAKGRTFQIGSYFNCDVILEPQAERLMCEITCDAFGRVTLHNQSNKDTAIHLNDKIIHGQRSHPLLHGNRITILDRVYTWESHKMSGSEDVASTPERLPPVEQAPNSCPSLKSHRPQIDKRLTVHNFHYSINSDEEGNTSIESRDQNESHLDEQESLNFSTPPSREMSSCETPKVDLVEATQNKENTATPTASHQQLLQLCALSDVVITSYSPRETGVKVEKSFTCVRKPTKIGKQAATASVTMSTPKSVYSTPKGGVLSELNDDSCSRDLMDFCTPSTSKKTKRQSSMYLIDLTTPSKLRPSFKPTPISVDSTDESSDGSPIVIDITKSATPPTPGRSPLAMTPRRPAEAVAATPTRTPQSLMKRALLTSTKKNQIAASQINKTPVATPNRPSPSRLSRPLPRMPFVSYPTPEQKEARHAAFAKKSQAPKSTPHKRQSLHLGTPRDNKLSQIRKSLAAAKRSPTVDMGIRLKAKARRTLNSPKSSSPQSGSSKPASPTMRTTSNVSHPKCSTPEKVEGSTNDDLSRTFTIMNESGDPAEEGSILGIMSALVTGEMDNSVASTTLPPTEVREDAFAEDQSPENRELQSAVEQVKSPHKDDAKLCENGTRSFVESCQKPDHFVNKESTDQSIQPNDKVDNIIEDNICEEVHANIPKQLDDDDTTDKLSKVIDICEEESPDIKSSDSVAEEENKEPTSRVETPMIRRSLRRLSVDQKASVATTPCQGSSTRRGSVGASSSQAETETEGSKKGTRRASCSALADTQEVSCTPRRKRRLSEQICTPTRQSKRLMMNTPKSTLQVDDSIGDMGVIVEEDDEKASVVEDENYGKELPCDEPDNVDYHGLKDLLKTPKNCSTPRFKGLREMMRTPKVPASPIFGNIEELLDNSIEKNKSGRSITVARVAVDNRNAFERVLKTPSARNIMVPNEPASAVLKSRGDSLATTTEYDLDMTNTTMHLDQIFDDVPSTSVANDTEAEINVTSLSTASGLDPLKESVSSEAPISVCKLEATGVPSQKNDPVTSTTYKTAMQADLELSTFTEEGEEASRPSSLGSNEMSGMQLLDQTSDSMFSEPLIVSGVESSNVTVDETRALGQTTYQPLDINDVDTDSNVGLTEPLVLSDDDEEADGVEDSRVTPKKSIAPNEVSIAYKLEESIASKDITLNQSKSKQSVDGTSVIGETRNRENDSLIDEVSLIEVNESLAGDSISISKDEKSLIIELDSSTDTDAEPTKDKDGSTAVELTIVDSETFPLDSTHEDEVSTSVDKKPVHSGYKEAELVTEVPTHHSDPQINYPLPSEEVLKSMTTDVTQTDEKKGNDVSVAEDPETLPADETANSSVIVDEELSTNGDLKPIDSESSITKENSTCETAEYQSSHTLATNELAEENAVGVDVSIPVGTETVPLDLTADSDIVLEEAISTNIDQKPKKIEEDQSVINAITSKGLAEEKITGDDEIENDVSAVADESLSFDLIADNSILVEEEILSNVDQKPIDSDLTITTKELDPANPVTEELSVIDALPFEEQAKDKITRSNTKETALAVDSDISPLDSTAVHFNPQAELLTNADQKPTDSESSITNEDLTGKPAESAIDILPSEESDIEKLASDSTTDNMDLESLGQDAKSEAGEVSVPKEHKSDDDDTAEKPKPEPEQITLELPFCDDIEIQKGDVEELPTCASAATNEVAFETPTPYIHKVEVMSPKDESVPEASAGPSPRADNIEVDETSAVQDTGAIDSVYEVMVDENIKDEAETGIMEDINPRAEEKTNGDESKMLATEGTSKQSAADQTQMASIFEPESDKEKTTIGQLSTNETAPATADKQSPLQEELSEDSNAAHVTTYDLQERDVAAIVALAVKERNEDEDNVSKANVGKNDSTSLETTQNESCGQEPVSSKVVPPKDNMAVEEITLNTSSTMKEPINEVPKSDSKEQIPIYPPKNASNQGEHEDEVNQLEKSTIAGDVRDDCFVRETPRATLLVNELEVVAASEEMSDQQVEFKPIEESSDRLKKSNEDEEAFIDTSKDIDADKESLKKQTCQIIHSANAEVSDYPESVKDDYNTEQPEEFTAKEKCQEESIADILESSAPLRYLSSSAVQGKSVSENPEAPNSSTAVDGAQAETGTEEPLIAVIKEDETGTSNTQAKTVSDHESSRDSKSPKDEPQNDESTSTDADSEGKSRDRTATEEEVQENPIASPKSNVVVLGETVSATDSGVNSLSETDHLSIEEKAKEGVNVTENEVISNELAGGTSAHRSESNTYIGEQPQPDEHHINVKYLDQEKIKPAAVKEVANIIELNDDSESNPVEEGHDPAPVPVSEANASVPIEETLATEDPRETRVEDAPEESTPIAKDRKTVKEISDIIELSDDSSFEPPPVEDHNPAPLPISEGDASVPIEATLQTEDAEETKVKDVPAEVIPKAENLNTINEPVSEANASVSIIETFANQESNSVKVADASDELQNGAHAAPVTNQEKQAGKPHAFEKLPYAEVDGVETTSITESVGNVEQDEKSQHKPNVEGFADEESPSKEKDETSGEVSSPVELNFEHVQDVAVSKKEASNSENIQNDKLATRIISSSEHQTSEKFREPSPKPSVSIKHSTMEAVHTDRTPDRHEDEPSAKEELKPGKRATRKGSAPVETPAQEALEKPSRRARKPSAEVEEIKSNDIHEKPKRNTIRKASVEVEPMTRVQDKEETNEEDALEVIPEEAQYSRANEDNDPQKEAVSDEKREKDVLEKPKRRARKPSAEAKSADITEKPKRRARKPSAEPMVQNEKQKEIEEEPKEKEQAHSSKLNKQHELQTEADSFQNEEVEKEKKLIENKEELAEEPNEQNKLQEEEGEDLTKSKETKKETIKSRIERPKRRGRKASAEETETTSSKKPKIDDLLQVIEETEAPKFTQMEQDLDPQKPKRSKQRGRKASAEEDANNVVKLPTSEEVLKSIVEGDSEFKATSTIGEEPEEARTEDRSRRRGHRPSIEVLEGTAASQPKSACGNAENPLATTSEDQPSNLTEPKGPQKRTRKSSELVPAEVPESAKETDHIERPKRRGRKPSVDIEHVVQDAPSKTRRRGRTPADPAEHPSGEAKEEEADKKSRRTARKPSAETIEDVSHNTEVEHLKVIEEVAEAGREPEEATATTTPLPEEEEPKTRRRGRKLKLETLEMPAKNTAEVGHSRLRGRKATGDEAPEPEGPLEADTNVEGEQHNIVPTDSNNEVQEQPSDVVEAEVTAAEKKTKRQVRKASAHIDEVKTVTKKTNTRRGRKEDTKDDDNGQEKKIDLQQVPTESVPAVVIMSSQIGDGAVGSEDEITPRRREGRNMPRKNYDETSDEDKQRSARRPRKPAPCKVLAFKAPEEESTPLPKREPVEDVETPANTVPITEPTSTQRREGRNVPRKNYTEAPDDDKPSTSRNRRVRNLTAKALELIVDSSPRPNTPKGRKGKAAAKDEPPAKRVSLEAAPPTQAESGAEEDPAPVIAKGRATRRKADDGLSEPGTAPPSKRGGRGQHEDSEEQPEAKPASRNARATARKAKVESDLNEAVPTKKARGGSRAKSPVKPSEESVTEPEEHSAPIKKGRGGTRAKTPVALIPEDTATKPEDEPAKKPSVRSRARGGTKAVAVPEPEKPAQDSDVEPVLLATSPSRGGRAKKVHFEPTETAAASSEDAPKRATRSRRK